MRGAAARWGVATLLATVSLALAVLALPAAAASAATTQAGPVAPGSGVAFFVRESDVRKIPAPGVVVTMMVVSPASDGLAVAPANRSGAAVGTLASSASSTTDSLGNAYFELQAGHTSGSDTFGWSDGHGHAGQVAVAVSSTATPGASPVVASAAAAPITSPAAATSAAEGVAVTPAGGGGATTATATPVWRLAVTAAFAVLVAVLLYFAVPRLLRRITGRRHAAK